MTAPLVGIIVPCFNQGSFAAECVASLHAQTYPNWRAVVVDDASTDDSGTLLDALRSDRVDVVHLGTNLGRSLVRNEAVRRLGAVDYVLNVDCDDVLSPEYVSALVPALETNPKAGLAYGTLHYFGERRPQTTWPTEPYDPRRRYLVNNIPGPGVLFRATALSTTEGWRADFTDASGEDFDIWLQIVEQGWEVEWVRDAVYHYRQHASSFLAGNTPAMQVDLQLAILDLHARWIRASAGTRAFLAPQVMPALYESLRHGNIGRARRILSVVLRRAPMATVALAARYYAGRLRR